MRKKRNPMEPQEKNVSWSTYQCPVCGGEITRDLLIFLSHTRQHIFEILKRKHPEWRTSGDPFECENYFARQFSGLENEGGGGR